MNPLTHEEERELVGAQLEACKNIPDQLAKINASLGLVNANLERLALWFENWAPLRGCREREEAALRGEGPMNPLEPFPRKERPGKMGFDNDYFIISRCTCCGVVMEKWNFELWKTQCSDCAPELHEDQGETTPGP